MKSYKIILFYYDFSIIFFIYNVKTLREYLYYLDIELRVQLEITYQLIQRNPKEIFKKIIKNILNKAHTLMGL